MRGLVLAGLLASAALAPVAAHAAPQVTVLFTGDNGGEVAPCG